MVLPLHQMVRDTHLSHKTLQETFEVGITSPSSLHHIASSLHHITSSRITTCVYPTSSSQVQLSVFTVSNLILPRVQRAVLIKTLYTQHVELYWCM